MMSLFYLLTMYTSIRAHASTRSAAWLVLSVLCCAMGMGCKEAMATAPLMVLLWDRTFVFASLGEACEPADCSTSGWQPPGWDWQRCSGSGRVRRPSDFPPMSRPGPIC